MRTPRNPTKLRPGALALIAATALAAGGLALAAGGLTLATAGPAAAAGSAFPAHFAAPYLQIGSSDAGDMAADEAATGLKYYTLAFLIPQSGCTPEWEDDGSGVGAFASQISAIQASGGNVIISFGGESGGELAQTCTSVSQLTAAYQNVVNTYGVTRLDFDIEGSVLSDTAATSLRDQALAALQAEDPSVQVDFTLAVSPQGLPTGTGSEYALLQDAQAKGVKVSVVNIMTMDFGAGSNDLADAESAAQGTASQLSGLYGISTSAAYGMMGLTPDRRHQRRRHLLLHLQRLIAGKLRRLQRRRGAVLLGGRRLRQAHRLPVLLDLQRDHREQRRRWRLAGSRARSPGTRACASMTARPAPRTSTRSRSTPATAPTRSSWTVESATTP